MCQRDRSEPTGSGAPDRDDRLRTDDGAAVIDVDDHNATSDDDNLDEFDDDHDVGGGG